MLVSYHHSRLTHDHHLIVEAHELGILLRVELIDNVAVDFPSALFELPVVRLVEARLGPAVIPGSR